MAARRRQSQVSLTDQVREMVALATDEGLYDAADWAERSLLSQQTEGERYREALERIASHDPRWHTREQEHPDEYARFRHLTPFEAVQHEARTALAATENSEER